MQDLTNAQFNSLKTLSKNPQINQVSIDMHGNGLFRITVISTDDADFNLIDMLLEDVFPHKEYRGSVGEDVDGDYYSIDVDGETLINLMMKKAPLSEGAPKERIEMSACQNCGSQITNRHCTCPICLKKRCQWCIAEKQGDCGEVEFQPERQTIAEYLGEE